MSSLSYEEHVKLIELVQEENDSELEKLLSLNSLEFKKLNKEYVLGFEGKTDK